MIKEIRHTSNGYFIVTVHESEGVERGIFLNSELSYTFVAATLEQMGYELTKHDKELLGVD